MPAAPRRLPTTRSGSGGAATGVRSPANPRRSPANPGPRGFGPHGPHGPGLAGDPILQLAQQQKQQLSDTEMSVTQQLADAFAALMDALMPSLQDFAAAYADELEKQNAEDDDDGSDSEGDDIGGFGTDSPVSGSGGALGGFTRRLPSPANPRIIGPAARRGPHPPGMLPTPTVRGAGPGTVPATWLLARSGGDAPRLLREIQGQVGKFAQNAQPVIAQGVASAQSQGTLNAEALLGALLQPGLAQSDSGLDAEDLLKTTTTAARDDAQFALLQNLMNAGGPLAQLLGSMPEETADQTYRTLLAGLGRGENPQALVSDLQQVLQSSQSRALTISRTEMMGAYRTAQIDAYRANDGVVQGWVWMADLGSACPMCTDLNGEIHPLDDDMVSHPRCRCNPAPITKSWDDILGPLGIDSSGIEETTLDLESGSDWFARQDADTQRSILGPSAYNAYQQGDLKLSDLVGRREDGSYYQMSLKEAGLDYRDYLYPSKVAGEPAVRDVDSEAMSAAQQAHTAATERLATAQTNADAAMARYNEVDQRYLAAAREENYWQAQVDGIKYGRLEGDLDEATAKLAAARDARNAVSAEWMDARNAQWQTQSELQNAQKALAGAQSRIDSAMGGNGYILTASDETRAGLSQLFGHDLSDEELAGLVGARPGDTISITGNGDYYQISLRGTSTDPERTLFGYDAERTLYRDSDSGKLVMYNASFAVDPALQGQGIGLEVFNGEAQNLADLGVSEIGVMAAGMGAGYLPEGELPDTNGFYTWARFGYNASVPWKEMFERGLNPDDVPDALRGLRTIQSLMRAEGGPAFWKEWGIDWNGTFNLSDGSVSMQVLESYLEAKGLA